MTREIINVDDEVGLDAGVGSSQALDPVEAGVGSSQVLDQPDKRTDDDDAGGTMANMIDSHCSHVQLRSKKSGKMAKHFQCAYCVKAFIGPSRSSLKLHLVTVHKRKCAELIEFIANNKNLTKKPVRDFFQIKMKKEFDCDVFMGLVLTWITKTDQPFSVIDDNRLEAIFRYLKHDIDLSSRRTLMRRLDQLYDQTKSNLKVLLQSFKSKVSITCDVWTSKNQLSFFGITVHYIDENYAFQEKLLAFRYFEGEHDGKTLAVALMEVIEDFDLQARLLGITVDNASNNTTMIDELEAYYRIKFPLLVPITVTWNKVECMAHVLNLGAQQILKNFKTPVDEENYDEHESADHMVTSVSRLAFLCRKIRKSPKIRRLMEKISIEKGVTFLVPIIDVCTRWNSTYDMLVRAYHCKDIIQETIFRHQDRSLMNLVLDDSDWVCINNLIDILKPLKEATLIVSQSKQSMIISSVIPLYHACTELLKEQLEKYDENDDIHIGISAAVEKLTHYYDIVSPMVGIALILNPSMKKGFLRDCTEWETSWIDTVDDSFRSAFEYYKSKSIAIQDRPIIETESKLLLNEDVERNNPILATFLKRKRGQSTALAQDDEYQRYFIFDQGILMLHLLMKM